MISSNVLSDPELRRFGKQISLSQIGLEGQENLKKAKVAVIGAGGLGTVVLQYLAASGVGCLGIIDYALVEETNIQRQTLYGGNDLGKLKTIISKQHLQDLFPLIDFDIINLQLVANNIDKILEPYDMVVDATNDPASHQVVCKSCESLNLPWIFATLNDFGGKIAVFDSNLNAGCSNAKFLDSIIPTSNFDTNGASSLTYGFIGNIIALEVVKFFVRNSHSLINKVMTVDMLSYRFDILSLNSDNK